jgi:hypothetical protein
VDSQSGLRLHAVEAFDRSERTPIADLSAAVSPLSRWNMTKPGMLSFHRSPQDASRL